MSAKANVAVEQLSSPWFAWQHRLAALFGRDPQVQVGEVDQTDDETHIMTITVEDEDKASALKALLDTELVFGNVKMVITILGPQGEPEPMADEELAVLDAAFKGNPLFVKTLEIQHGIMLMFYCVMAATIVQFWDDNVNDYQGNITILPADLAEAVLNTEHALYCTE